MTSAHKAKKDDSAYFIAVCYDYRLIGSKKDVTYYKTIVYFFVNTLLPHERSKKTNVKGELERMWMKLASVIEVTHVSALPCFRLPTYYSSSSGSIHRQ